MNWIKFIMFVVGFTGMSMYFDGAVNYHATAAANILFCLANSFVSFALSWNPKEI
jgi:hypothetical protein